MFKLKTLLPLLFTLSLNATAGSAAPALSSLSLERDCNGCPSGSRVVLYADGRAVLTTVGKGRLGTADEVREGRLPPAVFADLARSAQARGVADLPEDSADPQQQDGPWLQLRIEWKGGHAKQVFYRGEVQPPALAALVEAIDAASARIAFGTP